MTQIICNDLAIGYNNKTIISNIDFTINSGDYLCIVGSNGTGKSTLLKTLLHLIPAIKGEIIYTNEIKLNEIGYLPQQQDIKKDFPASVKEIVISGCLNQMGFKPFYSKKEKDCAKQSIERLGINDIENKSFQNLSGGQQQKVLLARALCATNKMLFMDEPMTSLDYETTEELYKTIKELNNSGVTIVMVTHDVKGVSKYPSHFLHLGTKSYYGTRSEYFNSDIGKKFLEQCEEVKDE